MVRAVAEADDELRFRIGRETTHCGHRELVRRPARAHGECDRVGAAAVSAVESDLLTAALVGRYRVERELL